LPGKGEEIGPALVNSAKTQMVVFTGSAEVGLKIIEQASSRNASRDSVCKVVAEMGGINALIVDEDADLDEAVKGCVYSAFGFQGQKCSALSRLIVHEKVYEPFIKRFKETMSDINLGPAKDPATYLSALIDRDAYERVQSFLKQAVGKQIFQPNKKFAFMESGYFVPPTLLEGVSIEDPVLKQEVFGPVVFALKSKSIQEAVLIANNSVSALTGGIYSRNPESIDFVRQNLEVGNLYINRSITGAIVGRHPFGGYKLSGVGSKAGGPDYLLQFVDPIVIVENTIRRGYAGDLEV
jgi:RHH-type transcriptional regulator, proline utilization regulon repressor / proline dehydrogenase / delta 1-pyrroline-5-carboxylate dehydrogenase